MQTNKLRMLTMFSKILYLTKVNILKCCTSAIVVITCYWNKNVELINKCLYIHIGNNYNAE